MKYIKTILRNIAAAVLATAAGAAFTACDDMLDTKPNGVFSSEQIGSDEAIDLLTAAYASLMNHWDGNNNRAFGGPINNWVFDLRSDDALKGGDALSMEGDMHQLEMGNVTNTSQPVNYKWLNNYASISRCNAAIRGIAASNLSDKDKTVMLAEMRTLRAYFYFDMYRIFKKFPYFDENVDPSTVPAGNMTREEIIDAIKGDLAQAYVDLPDSQPQIGRFNRFVAAALLARVALFDSDWATAETYAGYVISSGRYELYPNFLDMSKPEFNNMYEAVLAVQFTSANKLYNLNNCLNCTYSYDEATGQNLYGNGDDFYLGSQNLINAFRTDAAGLPYFQTETGLQDVESADYAGNVDPRLDFTFGRIGMPWRSYTYGPKWVRNMELYGQYSAKKAYPSPDSPFVEVGIVPWGASTLNMLLIRYADVLLMKAEALIEQNKSLDEARTIINDIRRRAARSVDPGYSPVDCNPLIANYSVAEYPAAGWTQDYARRAVRMERRLELAMEGLRWFDLVRWGIATETVNAYYNSEVRFHSYYQGAHLDEADLYLPIPQEQVDNAGDLYK